MTPPNGLDEILATFGDPHAVNFEAQYIVPFALPYTLTFGSAMVQRSRAHRLVVPIFQAVFTAIQDAGLVERATAYGGIYAARNIRGLPKFLSTHAWGIAIDLNPEENPLGGRSHQDPAVIEVFKAHGFTWGGDFKSRTDAMHFQFATGY